MSTSDAAYSELRIPGADGGEAEATRALLEHARDKRAEESCTNSRQRDGSQSAALGHHGKETRTDQGANRSHTGLPLRTDSPLRTREEEEEEGYCCGGGRSAIVNKKSGRCKFSSFLSSRLPVSFKCKKKSDPPESSNSDWTAPGPAEHTPVEPGPAEPRSTEPRPAEHRPAEPKPAGATQEHCAKHSLSEAEKGSPGPRTSQDNSRFLPQNPTEPANPLSSLTNASHPVCKEEEVVSLPTGSGCLTADQDTRVLHEQTPDSTSGQQRQTIDIGVIRTRREKQTLETTTIDTQPANPPPVTVAIAPELTDTQRLVPTTTDTQRLEPITTDSQRLEPTTTDTQRLEPTTDSQRLEPTTTDTQRLEPTTTGTQPTNRTTVSASVVSEFTGTDRPEVDSRGSQEYLNTRHTRVGTQDCSGATSLAEPPSAMLSSTIVSVIGPHWSGRFRRHKKVGTATGEAEQEAQGSEQEVGGGGGVSTSCSPQERTFDPQSQPAGESGEILAFRVQQRAPSLGNSRDTLGWLDERNPNSLKQDCPANRPVTKSLGVDWGRLDNRLEEEGVVTPVSPISSPVPSPRTPTSPRSLQLHAHRRMSQAAHPGDQPSSLSSKPTTSSILLSLRRFNSNWKNSNIGCTHSEAIPPTLSSLTNDRAPGSHIPHLHPTSPNGRERERLKSLLSSSSTSYRPPQTSRVYPTQSSSDKQTILASSLEGLSSSERPDLSRTAEVDITSSQTSQNGRLDFLKSRSLPRGTMLSSTSWWKHAEEGDYRPCSPLSPTNNVNNNINKNTIKDNTSLYSFPTTNKNDAGPQITNSNTSCSHRNINSINNNLSQSALHKNLNHMLRDTQEETSHLKTSKAQDLPDQRSHTSLLTPPALIPADPLSQKSHSLPGISYSSKISSAWSPVTFSGPETSLDCRPCRSNLVDTAQFHLSPESPEYSTSTPLSTRPQTSNTSASLCTSLTSRPPCRPHSIHRASPGRTSVGHVYLPTSPKSPTPSSVLFSQRSTETRTPTPASRSFSLAIYTPKPFSANTAVPRPIIIKTSNSTNHPPSPTTTSSSTSQPLHPQPTSTRPPLPSNATQTLTPQPLPPKTNLTSTLDESLPPGERKFTDSMFLSPRKQCPMVEGRGIGGRHCFLGERNWRNSVEQQRGDATTRGRSGLSESPPALTSPLSPSRPLCNVGGPSIYASLRSGSPSRAVPPPLSPPGARTSSLQAWRGDREAREREREETEGREHERERDERRVLSGSFDRPSRFTFNPLERGRTTCGPLRTQSEERTSCPRSASPLSLLSDTCGGRKLPFSSPPYRDLKSNSPPQGEVTHSTLTPTSPYKRPTSPHNALPISPLYSLPMSLPASPYSPQGEVTHSTLTPTSPYKRPTSSHNGLPISPLYPLPMSPPASPYSPPFSQQRTGSGQGGSKVAATETDSAHNNYRIAQTSRAPRPSHTDALVDDAGPQPFPTAAVEETPAPPPSSSSSSCVTVIETLVYMIPKASSYSGSTSCVRLAHSYTALQGPPACAVAVGSTSGAAELSQTSGRSHQATGGRQGDGDPVSDRKSVTAPSQTQSSNRGLFGVKMKRDSALGSTNAAGPSRERETAECERVTGEKETGKLRSGTTRTDLLARLKQTLNVKRSYNETPPLRRRQRASPTASDPGAAPGDEGGREGEEEREKESGRESKISSEPPSAPWNRGDRGRDGVPVCTEPGDGSAERVKNERLQFGAVRGELAEKESGPWPSMTNLSPTGSPHSDPFEGDGLDGRLDGGRCQSRRPPPCRERSPAGLQPWAPDLPATLPACRGSSASPRSPDSPFSSPGHKMSPSSPLLSPFLRDRQVTAAHHRFSPSSRPSREEWGGDSVFLSAVLPATAGRRKAASLCEPAEEEEARGQGSGVRCWDGDRLASFSSCADLKYGLEAGRSFSVSSVLSSRPSGPGRISTDARVASANDLRGLPDPFGGGSTWSEYSGEGDWMTSRSDAWNGAKSKSLPRSLLRSSTWGSEVTGRSPTAVTTTGQVWGPSSIESSHFLWDTEGPLTPPPSPPSRRMSFPPRSSPPFSAGSRVLQDSQTTRGCLPTRGYFSSLSAFDESGQDQDSDSDTSSSTTTDDEYCLGGEGDEEEKETEL